MKEGLKFSGISSALGKALNWNGPGLGPATVSKSALARHSFSWSCHTEVPTNVPLPPG